MPKTEHGPTPDVTIDLTVDVTGTLPVGNGGTGATAAANAANGVVILDASAKLPHAALKTYDSGWFAITANTDYTKTHNLGTTKVITSVYWATDSNGTKMQETKNAQSTIDSSWLTAHNITTTTVEIALGSGLRWIDDDGTLEAYTSGYARVIMLALE